MNNTNKNNVPHELIEELKKHSDQKINYDLSPLIESLRVIYGQSLSLIVLYGSCLRTNNFTDGILDFYVIVSNYQKAHEGAFTPFFNKALPPNVYYIEAKQGNETLRAKYAVISETDFDRGINNWFHPYLWARFAQPVRLNFARSESLREFFYLGLARAVIRYLNETLPLIAEHHVSVDRIWANALSLSYAAELRPEPTGRSNEIVRQSMDDLCTITKAALPALTCLQISQSENKYEMHCTNRQAKSCQRRWLARQWQGKLLSILRLTKAAFTFGDGIEYAAWKIHRHTGIQVEVTPASKRHPVIFGFKALWQLIRQKAIR